MTDIIPDDDPTHDPTRARGEDYAEPATEHQGPTNRPVGQVEGDLDGAEQLRFRDLRRRLRHRLADLTGRTGRASARPRSRPSDASERVFAPW